MDIIVVALQLPTGRYSWGTFAKPQKNGICQFPKSNKFPEPQPLLEHANGGPWQQEIPSSPEGGPNDMAGNIL